MKPADLAVFALTVQALVLGHGAVKLLFSKERPPIWFWVPLLLVIAYYVIAFKVPPVSLDRDAPVTSTLWVSAVRGVVQVASFSVLIESLLWMAGRKAHRIKVLSTENERLSEEVESLKAGKEKYV